MRAVVFAYQEIGAVGLTELLRLGVEVAGVVTHPDDPGEEIWFRSVAAVARGRGVPVLLADGMRGPGWPGRIRSFRPDAIFSFCFRRLIPDPILALAPAGAYNLHPSLLPKYRGRAPVNWALVHGERRTGLTLHHMVARADAGDIVAREAVEIGPYDDVARLYRKLAAAVPRILRRTVPRIADGTSPRVRQREERATTFGKRRPEDGLFRWEQDARRIHDLVRAVAHPYPGAFCDTRRGKLFVWKARPAPAFRSRSMPSPRAPGTIVRLRPLTVLTGKGHLALHRLQIDGGREMRASAFAREHRLRAGDAL